MSAQDLAQILLSLFTDQNPVSGDLTGPLDTSEFKRVRLRPAIIKGHTLYQFEYLRGAQAIHRNLADAEAREELRNLLPRFRRSELRTRESDYEVTVKPSGGIKVRKTPPSAQPLVESHDREKHRILPE